MELTKVQRQNLKLYVQYRSSPPTIWFLIRRNLFKRYLIPGFLVILLLLIAPTAGLGAIAWLAVGMLFSATLRDVALFRRFVHLWPVTSAVLDWERIDELLAESRVSST